MLKQEEAKRKAKEKAERKRKQEEKKKQFQDLKNEILKVLKIIFYQKVMNLEHSFNIQSMMIF